MAPMMPKLKHESTTAFEAHDKFVFSDHLDASIDTQWIEYELNDADDLEGRLIRFRVNATF